MEDLLDKDDIQTTKITTTKTKSKPVQRKSQKQMMELEESVKEYKQVKETYAKQFGAEDEKTMAISDIIAGQLFQLQRFDKALAMYVSLLEHYRNTYGPCDEKSLKVNEKIVLTYLMMGESEAFLEALESLCELYSDEMNYEASDVGQVKLMYVNYLEREGNYTTAELMLQELLSTYTTYYGDNDLRSIKIDIRIAEILIKRGDYNKALSSLSGIAEELEETHGHLNVETLDTRQLIASVYIKMGELDTALEMFIELFTRYMECYGGECYETLTIRTSIAATLLKQKNYEQALSIYTAVYESYLNLPETSPEVTTHVKHIIGHIHLKENRLYESQTIFREVLHEYEQLYNGDDTHTNVIETKASLGALLLKEKKFEESRLCYQDVLKQYKDIFGQHHQKTIQVEDILIDLNELDAMLTSDDKETIKENVRTNEANNFGSQDFEKYLLPKKTDFDSDDPMETKHRSVSMLTTKSGTASDITLSGYPDNVSITTEVLHRASVPVTPKIIRRPENNREKQPTSPHQQIKDTKASIRDISKEHFIFSDEDDSERAGTSKADAHSKYLRITEGSNHEKKTGTSLPRIIIGDEHENEVNEREIDVDELETMRSNEWDDVNLNSTRDSEREDIMADIRQQQLAKKTKRPPKSCTKCACCTIS